MTSLCVAIFVDDLAQAKRDMTRAAAAGADMVELRIDRISDRHLIRELAEACILPAIVTCRARWEGGECDLPDSKRLHLLQAACHGKVRYLDIELEAVRRGNELPVGRPIICSFHDFEGRPARLSNIIIEMNQRLSAVNKVAWSARSLRDCVAVFELLRNRTKPTIALCMGEAGVTSRILAKKFGALLTFASLEEASATAPGQVTVAQMRNLYRWDAIDQATKVYGVVASPVRHSKSPALHNAAFTHTNHNGVYLPFLVDGSYEAFKAFMESFVEFAPLDLSGLSVTIPHKENALRYLQEKNASIEPLARAIGAVNTIAIQRVGENVRLGGFNSDFAAILDAITLAMSIDREALAGRKAAVIGAGGTGRTALAALTHYNAKVTVYNRTLERAEELAGEFGARAASLDALADSDADIFLNTTSIGMSPNIDQSPFDGHMPALGPGKVVFDAIYNPRETKLLRQARAAGANAVSGIEMFVRQAVRQFELWTGIPAPVEIMRNALTGQK